MHLITRVRCASPAKTEAQRTSDLYDLSRRRWSGRRAHFRQWNSSVLVYLRPRRTTNSASHMRLRVLFTSSLLSEDTAKKQRIVLRSLAWYQHPSSGGGRVVEELWHKWNYACHTHATRPADTFCWFYRAFATAIIHYGRNHKIMRMIF